MDRSDAIAAGYLERDILIGGSGADTFVISNANQAYYLGGGDKDYALVKDFNTAEDRVLLHGMVSDYTQQKQGNDIHLDYHSWFADKKGSSQQLASQREIDIISTV
ncbi:MAG: hypothetical protein WBG63_01445 [Phormidesmis sp.]